MSSRLFYGGIGAGDFGFLLSNLFTYDLGFSAANTRVCKVSASHFERPTGCFGPSFRSREGSRLSGGVRGGLLAFSFGDGARLSQSRVGLPIEYSQLVSGFLLSDFSFGSSKISLGLTDAGRNDLVSASFFSTSSLASQRTRSRIAWP